MTINGEAIAVTAGDHVHAPLDCWRGIENIDDERRLKIFHTYIERSSKSQSPVPSQNYERYARHAKRHPPARIHPRLGSGHAGSADQKGRATGREQGWYYGSNTRESVTL